MESNHSETPMLHEATGEEPSRARELVETVERIVSRVTYGIGDGPTHDYFLHLSEYVDFLTPEDNEELHIWLERDALHGDCYLVSTPESQRLAMISSDGLSIEDDEAPKITKIADQIHCGRWLGAHRMTVMKMLEDEIFLRIEIIRSSDGEQQFPDTAVNVDFMRRYTDDGGGMLVQSCHIISDPNTGGVLIGDDLHDDKWGAAGDEYGEPVESAGTADSELEVAATRLQQIYNPRIRVDKPIDFDTWHRLITQPLELEDILLGRAP